MTLEIHESEYPMDSFMTPLDNDPEDRQFFVPLKKPKSGLKAQSLLHFNNPLSHNRPNRPNRGIRHNSFGLPGIPGLSRPSRQPQFHGDFRVSY